MITPGQFEVPGSTPITDPLQLQFLTQGQMGYMPQAQFLTPYQYGNFRTLPTPDVMGYAAQETGFIQNMLMANRGSDPFGILPAYTFNTYNPAVNARQQQVVAQRRMQDASALWAPLGVEMAANIGLTAFGGIPGMVASMLIPDWASPTEMVAQRRRSTREIQNLSTAKIFTGPDRDTEYGLGFGYQQARGLDRFLRQSAADDSIMKEGDWRDMLSLGMKYGQFDYANNAEQYKRILKNIRGNMTTMMEVIGSTDFEEIMKDMKRMQDMGARQQHYMNIARKEQQYARITGLSHQELVDTYGQSGALTFQQAGLNAMQGSITSMGNAALATYLQRTGAIDPTLMSHFGGVSGMAQQLTQASARANRNIMDSLLPGMMNDDFTGLDENMNLLEVFQDPYGIDKLLARAGRANSIGKQNRFNINKHKAMADVQQKYGPEIMEALAAKAIGKRLTGLGGEEGMFAGYQALGHSAEEAEAKVAYVQSGQIFEITKQAREEQRRKDREEREQRNSPLAKLGRWFETMKENWGQRVYAVADRAGMAGGPGTRGGGGSQDGFSSANMANTVDDKQTSHSDVNPDYYNPNGANGDVARGGGGPLGGLDLSKAQSARGKQAWRYIVEHPEDIGALSSWYETGKVGNGADGMEVAGKDNVGYAYGKYQTNTARGSHQEWMRDLYFSKDPRGREIVTKILAAGGITGVDEKNVYSKIKSADWGSTAILREYANQAKANGDFMEESQRGYIMKGYNYALKSIRRRGEEGAALAAMIDASPGMQQLLYDTAVQHGAGGAASLFMKAYRPGMDKRNFTENLLLNVRPTNFSDRELGAKLRAGRYTNSNYILQARYNIEDGIGGGGGGGYGPSDQSIADAASAGIARNAAEGVRLGVKYGLGEKGGTHRVVGKTHYDQRKKNPRLIKAGGYYVDCSGWVGESMYNTAQAMNQQAEYNVFDADAMSMFKSAMDGDISSEGIIDWFEDNDRIWQGKEVTEDLIRSQGTMIIGIDTGTTDFDSGRRHGIDHIVTAYVDPATGELMVSESSGSKGVHTMKYKDWIAQYEGKSLQGIYAGSFTRQAQFKGGGKNRAGGAGSGYVPGVIQNAAHGTSQEAADADTKEIMKLVSSTNQEQLNQMASSGWFWDQSASTVETAFAVQRDRERAYTTNDEEKARYEAQEKINIQYINDKINADRRKAGLGEITVTKEMLDKIGRNNSDQWTSSYEQFAGIGIDEKKYLTKEGNVDYSKMASENALFKMNVQLAEELGYTGDDRYKFALKASKDPSFASTYRQMFFNSQGFGNQQQMDDMTQKALGQYEDAKKKYSKVAERERDAAFERTQKLLGVGKEGFFSNAEFKEDYAAFISDTTRIKRPDGKESYYTRGQFAEQLPAVAGLLGELQNIYAAKQREKDDPQAIKALEEQEAGIKKTLRAILLAYNFTDADIEEFLTKHTHVEDQISDLNKLLGERNLGMNMSDDQVMQMRKWAQKGQEDTAAAYSDHFDQETYNYEGRDIKSKSHELFMERRAKHTAMANDKTLVERSRVYDVKSLALMERYKGAYNVFKNFGAEATEDEIMNFHDKEKVSDERAKQIADSLSQNGLKREAEALLTFRKEGKAPTIGLLDWAYDDVNKGSDKSGLTPVMHDPTGVGPSNIETALTGDMDRSNPHVMGQLSQGANNALEQMPGVMSELTGAIKELNGILKVLPRIGGAASGG